MIEARAKVFKAVRENDLDGVMFKDPLSEETRKAKRNLLVAASVCVLLAIFSIRVTSFASLAVDAPGVTREVAQGLACLVVIYLAIGFVFHAFVDLVAWKYEREKLLARMFHRS